MKLAHRGATYLRGCLTENCQKLLSSFRAIQGCPLEIFRMHNDCPTWSRQHHDGLAQCEWLINNRIVLSCCRRFACRTLKAEPRRTVIVHAKYSRVFARQINQMEGNTNDPDDPSFCDLLISTVQERPALWNSSHPRHADRHYTTKMWEEISAMLEISGKNFNFS